MTSAPRSASIIVDTGPNCHIVQSITRTPVSGPGSGWCPLAPLVVMVGLLSGCYISKSLSGWSERLVSPARIALAPGQQSVESLNEPLDARQSVLDGLNSRSQSVHAGFQSVYASFLSCLCGRWYRGGV